MVIFKFEMGMYVPMIDLLWSIYDVVPTTMVRTAHIPGVPSGAEIAVTPRLTMFGVFRTAK